MLRVLIVTLFSGLYFLAAGQSGAIVNEVDPGTDAVELVVISDDDCSTVNLQGWILDDNNGDFVGCANAPQALAGIGVAQGFIRFTPDQALWAELPPGTIIVIDAPGGALDDDLCDGIISVPVDEFGYFEQTSSSPQSASGGSYSDNRHRT